MTKTERILAAARDRFEHYGVAKTTMQEIASDAGVAVGTLYLYFSNKDELMVACTAEFVEQHRKLSAAILAGQAPAAERLRDYIVARFRLAAELRTSSRHAAEIARAVLRVRPDRIVEEGLMMAEVVSQLLKQGIANREFRVAQVDNDTWVFLYSISCFFPNALTNPPIEPKEKDLLMVVDWFINVWRAGSRAVPTARKKANLPKVVRRRLRAT